MLKAAVPAEVGDGNKKSAIRIMCSKEKPTTNMNATFEKLLERHPFPSIILASLLFLGP